MVIFAAHIEINAGYQYMTVAESKEELLSKLYHEVHEEHQLDIELESIFIVQNEEIREDVEKEVTDYFESCRMSYLISLQSED